MTMDVEKVVNRVLEANADLFAWSMSDMPEIDPEFHWHKLALFPEARPFVQRKRKLDPERGKVVDEEARKLLSVGFIREV